MPYWTHPETLCCPNKTMQCPAIQDMIRRMARRTSMWDPNNMFLNGPYAPWREQGEAFDLEIEGRLPDELNGALYRTSVSQFYRPEDPSRYHWFDGDGMIQALFLRDGRATYRNRYVETDGLTD